MNVENIANGRMASSPESKKVAGPRLLYEQRAYGVRARLTMFDKPDGCLTNALSGSIVARHGNQSFYEYCNFSV